MTRVYVAASSREIDRAERVIAALRSRGLIVTHDWPARMRALGDEKALAPSVLVGELRADLLRGVAMADIFLLLAPKEPTTGAWVELGYAAGMREASIGQVTTPISPSLFVSGDAPPWCKAIVMAEMPDDDAAVTAVARLGGGRG